MSNRHHDNRASAAVLALALATAGCAAETDMAPTTSTYKIDDNADNPADLTQAASGAQAGDATYAVPVDASLESFASYPVSHVKWEVKKGMRVLEYDLPEDLAGASNKVKLTGADSTSTWQLSGDAGMADCTAVAGQISCQESLPGVTVDVSAIQMRVDSGLLAQQKLAVTKVFQGDPLGVLRFSPR